MPLMILNGPVILAGESLSDGIEVGGGLVRMTMPSIWTPANITFQISTDGEGYNDLVHAQGMEFMMPVVPGSAVILTLYADALRAIQFLKIRSGSRDFPVIQPVQTEFALTVDPAAK